MKRLFDLTISLVMAAILIIPAIMVAFVVKFTSKGPVLYWSNRVGQGNRFFAMPKFRTMLTETPVVATHELRNAKAFLTPVGGFLRKSSLDEIPQLWCILRGEMSLVGPRPALFSQKELIEMRTERGVDKLVPGLTGWAQVNGRDEIDMTEKVNYDEEYLNRKSIFFDLKIILITIKKVFLQKNISH